MANGDDESRWNLIRRQLLFFGGLIGFFIYVVLVNVLAEAFHVEFVLAFLAMMGVSIAQGIDKK